MSVKNKPKVAQEFLETLLGKDAKNLILRFAYPPKTGQEHHKKGGKQYYAPFKHIEDIFGSYPWSNHAHRATVHFCASQMHSRKYLHGGYNLRSLPAIYFDIDSMRETGMDGNAFWSDIKDFANDANILVRSSNKGVQGYYLLDEPLEFPKGEWVEKERTQKEEYTEEEAEEDQEDESEEDKNADVDGDLDEFEDTKERGKNAKPRKGQPLHPVAARKRKELADLMWNVAYYFGGDPAVRTVPHLMRLPGTHNFKYATPDYCPMVRLQEERYTYKQLVKKFPYDATVTPYSYGLAICYALAKNENFKEGARNKPLLALMGNVRKAGLDLESAKVFAEFIRRHFKTDNPSEQNVEGTYNAEHPATLSSDTFCDDDFKEQSAEINKILEMWVKFKSRYCRANKDPWKPDRPDKDPLGEASEINDEPFEDRDNGVFMKRADKEQGTEWPQVSNFNLRPIERVLRNKLNSLAIDVYEIWEITLEGKTSLFKWDATTDVEFSKFKTINGLPMGAQWFNRQEWGRYVAWLRKNPPTREVIETEYFGILDADSKPTVVLPGVEHKKYTLAIQDSGTALSNAFRHVGADEIQFFLPKFIRAYSRYHEDRVVWPTFGWFFACLMNPFIRQGVENFPILNISGHAGSGKTSLIKNILSPMFGCFPVNQTTTLAAMRSMAESTNIVPLVIDDRVDTDPKRSSDFQDFLRALYDEQPRLVKQQDGTTRMYVPRTPAFIGGENPFLNEANRQRNYEIPIDLSFVQKVKTFSAEEGQRHLDRIAWLKHKQWVGFFSSVGIRWVEENLAEIPDMIAYCRKMVAAQLPASTLHRELSARTAIAVGLMAFNRMCRSHGVKTPLNDAEIIRLVMAGDPDLGRGAANSTFKLMWDATDVAVMNAGMNNKTYEGGVYKYKPGTRFCYFQLNRWFDVLRDKTRHHDSATLNNYPSFVQLIRGAMGTEASPFIKMGNFVPEFGPETVKVDMDLVLEQYGKNIRMWGELVEDN